MKTIREVLNNYKEYETFLDDRFGVRFCDFLTKEQMNKINYITSDENHKPLEWTRDNVLAQLKNDVAFGWEKCQDERSISASLMASAVCSWCKVLDDEGIRELDCDYDYGCYGDNIFKTVDEFYGFGITH